MICQALERSTKSQKFQFYTHTHTHVYRLVIAFHYGGFALNSEEILTLVIF